MKKKNKVLLVTAFATLGAGVLFSQQVSSMENGESFADHIVGQCFQREDHQRMHEYMHNEGNRVASNDENRWNANHDENHQRMHDEMYNKSSENKEATNESKTNDSTTNDSTTNSSSNDVEQPAYNNNEGRQRGYGHMNGNGRHMNNGEGRGRCHGNY